MPPRQPVVLIADALSPATVAALGDGFDVRRCDGTDRAALLAAVAEADALMVRSGDYTTDLRVLILRAFGENVADL